MKMLQNQICHNMNIWNKYKSVAKTTDFYYIKIITPILTNTCIGYIISVVMKMEKKMTKRDENAKKMLTNRLNRIEGQIRGIKKMIEEDRYCNDILIQLLAVENSVKSLSNQILETHLYTCISNDIEKGNIDVIDELISLFKRFNK